MPAEVVVVFPFLLLLSVFIGWAGIDAGDRWYGFLGWCFYSVVAWMLALSPTPGWNTAAQVLLALCVAIMVLGLLFHYVKSRRVLDTI